MALANRPLWALALLAFSCVALLLVAGPMSHDGSDRTVGWLRAGQTNLAGWAVYEGHPDAGADLSDAVGAADLNIVGVAEACEKQLAEAERRLAVHADVQAVFQRTVPADHSLPWGAQTDDECVYGIGLIARGPVKLTDVRAMELPTLDGAPGGFDREEDRWVLCARTASDTQRMDGLHVCTTHFTRWEVTEGRRLLQANHLAGQLSSLVGDGSPVLVLADLNARRGDPDIDPLYDLGLSDVGDGDSRDHVLVSGLDHGALRGVAVGLSDHELVWAAVAAPAAVAVTG
jgi:hypothetical protein